MAAWTEDDAKDIEELVAERAAPCLREGERVRVSGEDDGGRSKVRFVLEGGTGGERLMLDAKVETHGGRGDARDFALDALDALLLEYLEGDRSARCTGVWETRELRGREVQVRLERTFPSLDSQADALLGGRDGEG